MQACVHLFRLDILHLFGLTCVNNWEVKYSTGSMFKVIHWVLFSCPPGCENAYITVILLEGALNLYKLSEEPRTSEFVWLHFIMLHYATSPGFTSWDDYNMAPGKTNKERKTSLDKAFQTGPNESISLNSWPNNASNVATLRYSTEIWCL